MDKRWSGEIWRPLVERNKGYLISGNKPIPPHIVIPYGKYEVIGTIMPAEYTRYQRPDTMLLTVRFYNVTGFHFSIRDKPKVVNIAEWFGPDVGVELADEATHKKVLIQSNDPKLARKIFSGDDMSELLSKYHSAVKYGDREGRIEINPNPTIGSICQLRSFYSWILVDRLQTALDILKLILQRMTDAGTARPL